MTFVIVKNFLYGGVIQSSLIPHWMYNCQELVKRCNEQITYTSIPFTFLEIRIVNFSGEMLVPRVFISKFTLYLCFDVY